MSESAEDFIRRRDTAQSLEAAQNVARNLAARKAEIRSLQGTLQSRLRASGFPNNEYFSSCLIGGAKRAVWVKEYGNYWVGTLEDGTLLWLQGDWSAKSSGSLSFHSYIDINDHNDGRDVNGLLGVIAGLLMKCSDKRFPWD